MTTITNDFHNTEAKVRAGVGETVSARTAARVRRVLCGMDECRCGGRRQIQRIALLPPAGAGAKLRLG